MAPASKKIEEVLEEVLKEVFGENRVVRNPAVRMLIKDIEDPDKLEEKLQEEGLATSRLKREEGPDVLVAYHEKTLEKLIKGPFPFNPEYQDPHAFIRELAKDKSTFDLQVRGFIEFLGKTNEEHLADLRDVGHERKGMYKYVGYLPHKIIEYALGKDGVQQMEKELQKRGMRTLNLCLESSKIKCLFTYDRDNTAGMIAKSECDNVFKDKSIPRDVDQFAARLITHKDFTPGTPGWRLSGVLFADPVNARSGL